MNLNALTKTHKKIVLNQEIVTEILNNIHKRYRSGVGSLLYLVKICDTNYLTRYVNYQNV